MAAKFVITFIIGLVAYFVWTRGLLNWAGFPWGETDIRKVMADRDAYAGQTLKSEAVMEAPWLFRGQGPAFETGVIYLMTTTALRKKGTSITYAIGTHKPVMIKYRIHDAATLAKIRAYGEETLAEDDPKGSGVLIDIWIP